MPTYPKWLALAKQIESFLFAEDYKPAKPESLRVALGIPPSKKKHFQEALSYLLREDIVRMDKGLVLPIKEEELLTTGVIRIHPRGFGFLQPDDKKRFSEDIFIPKHLTKGAVDGDTVEVEVSATVSEKGPEGAVTGILKRSRSRIAGIVCELFENEALIYAPLLGAKSRLRVPVRKSFPLKIGDRVVAEVLEWGNERKESFGEVKEIIGPIENPLFDVPAAVQEFGLQKDFPPHVLKEVASFGTQVTKKDLENREDLRDVECFTIDPDTAKDFDDALSLGRDKKGHFHLGVHIADVSHYVKSGTDLDEEARNRCNSVYFPGTVVPMLPHELSSHLCSLKPNVIRLTLSVFMTFDDEANLLNYRICRSFIRSAKRFTYKEAFEVLEGRKKSKHKETLVLMCELCKLLKRKRYERGSIEFCMPELKVHVDEKGIPTGFETIEYDITHQLVEEFMLKANEIVAGHLKKEGKTLTYRIHDEPSQENMKEFVRLANSFGFTLPDEPTSSELQSLFEEVRSSSYGQFLATAFIRSMRLAVYSTENIGHYGLGLEHYTHFTSPIRRYVDLIIHRLLLNEADPTDDLQHIALQCSDKERLAAKAEQSVTTLKKLRLLDEVRKKDPYAAFEAIITSIKPFGFVFEVLAFMLEGFIPISEIDDDFFVFHEKSKKLSGNRTHTTYQAGDAIHVTLKQINLITQETRWSLIPKTQVEGKKGRRKSKKRERRRKR